MENHYRNHFAGLFFILAFVFGLTAAGGAGATTIGFSSTTEVGGYDAVTSALLEWDLSGNTLTITIDNTSPTTDSGGNSNSPAITGFGFDISNDVNITSISVSVDGVRSSTFGGSASQDPNDYWSYSADKGISGGGGPPSALLDWLVATTNGVNGGLVNPSSDASTGSSLFDTTAVFTIVFDGDPGEFSDWAMRFQNVGLNGAGSSKVEGTEAPIPGAVWLLGSGILGLIGLGRRWRKS
jgi:hypothetical protein